MWYGVVWCGVDGGRTGRRTTMKKEEEKIHGQRKRQERKFDGKNTLLNAIIYIILTIKYSQSL